MSNPHNSSSVSTAPLTRRALLVHAPAFAIAAGLSRAVVAQNAGQVAAPPPSAPGSQSGSAPGDWRPQQNPDLVREIVGASHRNLERVRELLREQPALANATWDWGFGDWETALGAASHTGQREIATLLTEHGARPDLFTFAMLGQLDVVTAYIAANPGIQRRHGPHGITLLKHAKAGGPGAASVVAYLESLGDADPAYVTVPLGPEQQKRFVGAFRLGLGADDVLEVRETRSGGLSIQRGPNDAPRNLFYKGDGVFHPPGAPAVRIEFYPREGLPETLKIVDGGRTIDARRI